jgi:hypothetical protein
MLPTLSLYASSYVYVQKIAQNVAYSILICVSSYLLVQNTKVYPEIPGLRRQRNTQLQYK